MGPKHRPKHQMASLFNAKVTQFLTQRNFLLIYPAVFLFGELISLILPSQLLDSLRKLYWFSSRNVVNKAFAYEGNTIFLVLFVALVAYKLYETKKRTDEQSNYERVVKNYLLKLAMKYAGLWLLFWFIDHLFILTGGSCTVDDDVVSRYAVGLRSWQACQKAGGDWRPGSGGYCIIDPVAFGAAITDAAKCEQFGDWEGGFDVSGHFCFLVTISLIFWEELSLMVEANDFDVEMQLGEEEDNWFTLSVKNGVRWVLLSVLVVWANILVVTASFYHTSLEKLMGLAFGYLTPTFMYALVIPRLEEVDATALLHRFMERS